MLPSEALKTRLRAVSFNGITPSGGLLAQQIEDAAAWLADGSGSGTLGDAAAIIDDPTDPALVGAAARAVAAYALTNARGEIGAGPDALYIPSQRDALVAEIAGQLGGGVKGLGGWLFGLAKNFVEARATADGRNRRAAIMTAASPGIGDILLYQRRGQAILDLLAGEIEMLSGDVYVIGHSLGAIFLVDLLSCPNSLHNVKKLITVGSQSPFFLACDALKTLRPRQCLETLFRPWLNIYDRNDILSFCASRYFNGLSGIEDFEVASGVPFPDSHGSYWRLDDVYHKVAAFCS